MMIPKMIIFDAGKTLIDYVAIDTLKGVESLMPYIVSNPRQLSACDIDTYTNKVFECYEICREQLFEVHEQRILKLIYDLLELEFSISLKDVEQIIWEKSPVIKPVDYVGELLDELNKQGIQTAVISNLDFSSELLQRKLNELFPNNQFQFVITSSDYGIRKPNPYLFRAGIIKSGRKPEEIWYIGDKVSVDVAGSKSVGMTPVLFRSQYNSYEEIPSDVLVIDDFRQLLNHLKIQGWE